MFTIPNLLTLLRFVMVPAFLILFFSPRPLLHLMATVIYVLAAITDWFDGWLARRLQQKSELGRIADPLADKLLAVGVYLSLLLRGDLIETLHCALFCVILIALFETGIVTMSVVSLYRGVQSPLAYIGKLKTAGQLLTLFLLLLRLNLQECLPEAHGLHAFTYHPRLLFLLNSLMLLITLLTAITFATYALRYPRHREELRAARRASRERVRRYREKQRDVKVLQQLGDTKPEEDNKEGAW